MLTKQDLSQIKNILQTELKPINKKLLEHDKQFEKIQKQFVKNNKDHATMTEYFEIDIIHNKKRLDRIESHLGLPALSIS